jgi:hypothetical protein
MHNCYLCESPIERADDTGLGVFVACSDSENHHMLCSMCTGVVQEAKKQLKKMGKVLVFQTVEGVVAVADPSTYRIK